MRSASVLVALAVASELAGCAALRGRAPDPTGGGVPPELRARGAAPDVEVALEARAPADARRIAFAEALEVARARSSEVLVAAAELDAATGRAQAEAGALLPSVSLAVGGQYLRGRDINNSAQILDGLDYVAYEPSVGLRYRLNVGASVARTRSARLDADAAAWIERDATRRAMRGAALAYLELELAFAAHAIGARLVTDAERFVAITRARAAGEIGSGADVARAEADLARARQTQLRARASWERASIRLAVLLRWPPGERLVPGDPVVRPHALVDVARTDALREAAGERADVRAAEASSAAASRRVTGARWDLAGPDLDAGLRERLFGTDLGDLRGTTLAHVFVGFSFDVGELGRLREARGLARAAAERERALLETAIGEVETAVAGVDEAIAIVPEAEAEAEAAERSYRAQLARFEAGTGLGLEVIEAQNALARARLSLVEAIVRHDAAQVELAAAIGALEPAIASR